MRYGAARLRTFEISASQGERSDTKTTAFAKTTVRFMAVRVCTTKANFANISKFLKSVAIFSPSSADVRVGLEVSRERARETKRFQVAFLVRIYT